MRDVQQTDNKLEIIKYIEDRGLPTPRFVTDEIDHYDIDGVSFGCGWVIVASDAIPWFTAQSKSNDNGALYLK